MTQRKDGPFPYKSPAPDPNPLLTAIARNPHPFIMVSVGLVGMLALVLFNTVGRGSDERAPQPPAAETTAAPQQSSPVPAVVLEFPDPADALPTTVPDAAAPERVAETVAPESVASEAMAPASATPGPVTSDVVAPQVPTPEVVAPEAVTPGVTGAINTPYIVLILDDIGNNAELGRRAVSLPGAVTYALLPHTPHAANLAEQAHSLGKEIMLHAPMSNQAHFPLGPGALTDELSQEEFMQTLQDSISSIPYLQGVNNHMGSALTEKETQMTWVMEALREHDLYFVDSLTTAQSVAGRVAREQNIPTITRNVFLDNETTFENIDREFQRLLALAEKNGSAVGIGHPHIETLEYLEQALPALAERNIELVPVSLMIARKKAESNPEPSEGPNKEPAQELIQTEAPTGAW